MAASGARPGPSRTDSSPVKRAAFFLCLRKSRKESRNTVKTEKTQGTSSIHLSNKYLPSTYCLLYIIPTMNTAVSKTDRLLELTPKS